MRRWLGAGIGLVAAVLGLTAPGLAARAGSPCAVHIPIARLPKHVTVMRAGHKLSSSGHLYLQQNDKVHVSHGATLRFSYAGNAYRLHDSLVRMSCRRLLVALGSPPRTVLAVTVKFGLVDVIRVGRNPRTAAIVTPEMVALGTVTGGHFDVSRSSKQRQSRASPQSALIVVFGPAHPLTRVNARARYTAISDARGLRLDVWPFSISSQQRATNAGDRLPAYWADGRPCSVGCRAPGTPGWPLKPFHEQHTIRSGIDELRTSGFHVAEDIDAGQGQAVYPIESGYVNIRYPGTPDVNVDVGHFYYWHITPSVHNGQYVTAYKTVLGHVIYNFKHVAFSEVTGPERYINPLRPGGLLRPYSDTERPIIGTPHIYSDGRVTIGAFDPQSHIDLHSSYETPVLAPAALAWRIYNPSNHAVTGLEWALRGSQVYPPGDIPRVFAPGAKNPGFNCFAFHRICIPNWVYWLAGGMTARLPLGSLHGRYRLTIYAWDWAGNTSARDYWFNVPLAGPYQRAPSGRPHANFDYQ
jgi:hypothetical protein